MTVRKQFHSPVGITERELTVNETSPELKNEYEKDKAFNDNMPDWSTVSDAIDNINDLAGAKVFLKKLSRVVHWLAKNKID